MASDSTVRIHGVPIRPPVNSVPFNVVPKILIVGVLLVKKPPLTRRKALIYLVIY